MVGFLFSIILSCSSVHVRPRRPLNALSLPPKNELFFLRQSRDSRHAEQNLTLLAICVIYVITTFFHSVAVAEV